MRIKIIVTLLAFSALTFLSGCAQKTCPTYAKQSIEQPSSAPDEHTS